MEHSVKEIYEMHVLVKGKVQGVGFRALTHSFADALGITGTVRNLENGNVEIYAHGTKKKLEEFMGKIKDETYPGQIEEAAIEFFPIASAHEKFKIIY